MKRSTIMGLRPVSVGKRKLGLRGQRAAFDPERAFAAPKPTVFQGSNSFLPCERVVRASMIKATQVSGGDSAVSTVTL